MSREEQVARIKELAKRWIPALGLSWWKIDFYYEDDPREFYEPEKQPADGWRRETLMQVHADWRYMVAAVRVNVSFLEEFNDEELEGKFLHEMGHVFVSEISVDDDVFRAHEERVATTLAHAFGWVRDATLRGELPKPVAGEGTDGGDDAGGPDRAGG